MSTQKVKFELFNRLQKLGFTFEEAVSLRRIEIALKRWAEQECGTSNDHASFSIERDEATGKPFRCVYPHSGRNALRYPVADREAGALRRLKAIVAARNAREGGVAVVPYHQGDPRGCALYLLTSDQLSDGAPIDNVYTRGLAVCA